MIPPKPAAPPPHPGGDVAPTSTSIGQVEANFATGSLNMQIPKPRNPPPLPPGFLFYPIIRMLHSLNNI